MSARAIAVGLALGVPGALVASWVLQIFLFRLSPLDPASYAQVALILGAAGLAAANLPARRALRVDPVLALRAE